MNYVIATAVSLITAFISWFSLNKDLANKVKLFAIADKDESYTSKDISRQRIVIYSILLAVVSFLATVKIMDRVTDPIGITKMLIALLCMAGAACFDFREHRIPNFFPAVLAVGAILLLALGVFVKQAGAVSYITTSVFAAVGCTVALFIVMVLTKQGVGAGDIKLIGALALMTGVYAIIGTLFFGVMVCSIYAVFALLLKKKTKSSGVPFGPFLFLGYIITVFVTEF